MIAKAKTKKQAMSQFRRFAMLPKVTYIKFADATVASICATNWGDGNGITQKQINEITSLNTKFASKDITLFNELKLFKNLTIIGRDFYGCSNLISICLPVGITSIGSSAFENCTNLALTELPSGITSIGSYAFRNCTNLALKEMPECLINIGYSAFQNCTNLSLTKLSTCITSIGTNAFRSCTNLALTELPGGLITIENSAFQDCTNLALTELPSGITSIGSYAFAYCTKIESLTVPETPPTITTTSFSNTTFTFVCQSYDSYELYMANTNWAKLSSRFKYIDDGGNIVEP